MNDKYDAFIMCLWSAFPSQGVLTLTIYTFLLQSKPWTAGRASSEQRRKQIFPLVSLGQLIVRRVTGTAFFQQEGAFGRARQI